jgi:uncharacterized protein YbaA (DUF1428 family)
MTYIDGFLIPAGKDDKNKVMDHARRMDGFFLEHGALRVVEAWGDDVPRGKQTDFYRAVEATEEETVVFSWIEWPDKATRDAAFKAMEGNEQLMSEPMPFDGKRMIFGGFTAEVVLEK